MTGKIIPITGLPPLSVIHIAGLPVKCGQRMVQRCGYCGTLLIEVVDGEWASTDGRPPGNFEPNALVEVGPNYQSVVAYNEADEAPDGFCGKAPDPSVLRN